MNLYGDKYPNFEEEQQERLNEIKRQYINDEISLSELLYIVSHLGVENKIMYAFINSIREEKFGNQEAEA